MKRAAFVMLLILWGATMAILLQRADDRPRLIGYNCEGATGELFANSESDFPECERIERNR